MNVKDVDVNKQVNTVLALSNIGMLVSNVIKNIAGNSISNSINGSKITSSIIHNITYRRVLTNIGI